MGRTTSSGNRSDTGANLGFETSSGKPPMPSEGAMDAEYKRVVLG